MIYILDVNENIVANLSNDNPGACPYYQDSWKERLNDALITYDFSAPMDHENSRYLKNDGYIIRESPSGVLTLLQIIETHESNIDDMPVTEVYTENSGLELLGNVVDPADYTGRTLRESATIALTGTRWEIGRIDWVGNVTDVKIDDFETSLAVIQEIAKDTKAELQFRVEINPDKSISRYIDFLTRRGVDTAKRYEHAHDLIEAKRISKRETVATAIIPVGKGGEGGERLTIENIAWSKAAGDPVDKPLGQNWIGDEEARMRWGNGGLHIKKKLDTALEDPARLIQAGWDELQVKKEASVLYEMKVLFFRSRAGYTDETINIGDGIEAYDPTFYPELLLYARILEYDISFTDPEESELKFGNYRILKSNINSTLREIQSTLIRNDVMWTVKGTKIITGPDTPAGTDGVELWVDTSDPVVDVWKIPKNGTWVEIGRSDLGQLSGQLEGSQLKDGTVKTEHFVATGIDAKVIQAGVLGEERIAIGSGTTYGSGYDPTEKTSIALPYSTTATGTTDVNKWTRIAQAYIYTQYAAVDFSMSFAGISSGGAEKRYAEVGFRIKQQEALGNVPNVEIAYTAGQSILPEHFKAIATSVTTGEMIMDIYVYIPFSYEEYFFDIYNVASVGVAGAYGLIDQAFLTDAELPAGTSWSGTDLSHNPTTGLVKNWQHEDTTYIAGGSIYTNSITANEIAANTITADEMNIQYLSALTADLGTVTAGTIDGVLYRSGTGTDSTLRMESGFISMVNKAVSGNLVVWTDTYIADGAITLEYAFTEGGTPEYTSVLSPDDFRLSTAMSRSILQADFFEIRRGTDPVNPTNVFTVSLEDTFSTIHSQDSLKIQAGGFVAEITASEMLFAGGKYKITSTGIPFTTEQETGYYATSGVGNASSNNTAFRAINFRTRKTYGPASIAYTATTGNADPKFTDISQHGFMVYITTSGSSVFQYARGYYTA